MNNPLVSILLLTYNQENYVAQALEGIFEQDYANVEIIVSDDCSSDNTPAVIRKFIEEHGKDKHVLFNRNEHNLGLVGNCNKAYSLSHGDYLILAAGDDVSLKNRVSLSVAKIMELGVDVLGVNFQYITGEGKLLDQYGFNEHVAEKVYTLQDYICQRPAFPYGPSRIVSRRIFEEFGLLHDDCQTEDTTLTLRALLLNGIAMVNQVCVLYRWHENNLSSVQSLMKRINPVLIYQQYKRDLDLAYKKGLVSTIQYYKVLRILLDYKQVQLFIRRLYRTKGMIRRHFVGVRFVLNPFVLGSHKSRKWLMRTCPEIFMVRNKIQCMLNL